MTFLNMDYFIYINISFVTILFLLFLYLIINKIRDIKYEKAKEKLVNEIRPKIQSFVFSTESYPSRAIPKNSMGVEVVEGILSELSTSVKDETLHQKVNQLAKEILTPYYEKWLRNKKWSTRMNTYFQIENFLMSNFEKALWKMYKYKEFTNDEEMYQQIKTLASLHSQQLKKELITTKVEFPKFIYKEIIRRYEEDVLFELLNEYQNLPLNFRVALLEMIGEMKIYSQYQLIEEGLSNDELEIRLASLKVLIGFGYVTDLTSITPFSHSSHFAERMLFARLCVTIKKERFKELLVQLLTDENWFVRNAAGEAIMALPNGDLILNRILETHKDPFARDMAKQWITR